MPSTSPARIDDDLFVSAKAVGALMSRSAAQQVSHWARIGRELEAAKSVSQSDIAHVLEGSMSYDLLPAQEQSIVRAEWAERINSRLADLDLSKEFAARGVSYAELDANGEVVVRTPAARPARRKSAAAASKEAVKAGQLCPPLAQTPSESPAKQPAPRKAAPRKLAAAQPSPRRRRAST